MNETSRIISQGSLSLGINKFGSGVEEGPDGLLTSFEPFGLEPLHFEVHYNGGSQMLLRIHGEVDMVNGSWVDLGPIPLQVLPNRGTVEVELKNGLGRLLYKFSSFRRNLLYHSKIRKLKFEF